MRSVAHIMGAPKTDHPPELEGRWCAEQDMFVTMSAEAPHLVKHVSPGWLSFCGFRADEVEGKTLRIIQGPSTESDVLSSLMDAVHKLLKGAPPSVATGAQGQKGGHEGAQPAQPATRTEQMLERRNKRKRNGALGLEAIKACIRRIEAMTPEGTVDAYFASVEIVQSESPLESPSVPIIRRKLTNYTKHGVRFSNHIAVTSRRVELYHIAIGARQPVDATELVVRTEHAMLHGTQLLSTSISVGARDRAPDSAPIPPTLELPGASSDVGADGVGRMPRSAGEDSPPSLLLGHQLNGRLNVATPPSSTSSTSSYDAGRLVHQTLTCALLEARQTRPARKALRGPPPLYIPPPPELLQSYVARIFTVPLPGTSRLPTLAAVPAPPSPVPLGTPPSPLTLGTPPSPLTLGAEMPRPPATSPPDSCTIATPPPPASAPAGYAIMSPRPPATSPPAGYIVASPRAVRVGSARPAGSATSSVDAAAAYDILSSNPLLRPLDRATIATLLSRCAVRKYARYATVVRAGTVASPIYVVLTGSVLCRNALPAAPGAPVTPFSTSGHPFAATLGVGASFAESSLRGELQPCDVIAGSGCTLLCLASEDVRPLPIAWSLLCPPSTALAGGKPPTTPLKDRAGGEAEGEGAAKAVAKGEGETKAVAKGEGSFCRPASRTSSTTSSATSSTTSSATSSTTSSATSSSLGCPGGRDAGGAFKRLRRRRADPPWALTAGITNESRLILSPRGAAGSTQVVMASALGRGRTLQDAPCGDAVFSELAAASARRAKGRTALGQAQVVKRGTFGTAGELADWLHAFGVSTAEWGRSGAKTAAHLYKEVEGNETTLQVRAPAGLCG